ncbi:MAG TPA: ABC transporter permease subunit, partial [Pirellula sp.]|nr:ABC transporter permease subunit [Pirellula sp.]
MNAYLSNGRLWRLCRKELRESLRDRRTLFTLVLMPILVYPLLSMVLQRLVIGSVSKSKADTAYVLGIDNEESANQIQQVLTDARRSIASGFVSPITILRPTDSPDKETGKAATDPEKSEESSLEALPKFDIVVSDQQSLSKAFRDGNLDIVISKLTVESIQLERGSVQTYQVLAEFRQNDVRSETALSGLRRAIQMLNDYQAEMLRKRINRKLPVAMTFKAIGIADKSDLSASIAGVIPLVLILMTITGAVYPAIDLTAGERERGTMEALIATPAPRFALLLSKYVAVVTVAVLTALANLFATWMTLSFGGLGQALLGKNGFSIWTFVQILPLLVIFASFFSAILLALCSFARSFKEAQA